MTSEGTVADVPPAKAGRGFYVTRECRRRGGKKAERPCTPACEWPEGLLESPSRRSGTKAPSSALGWALRAVHHRLPPRCASQTDSPAGTLSAEAGLGGTGVEPSPPRARLLAAKPADWMLRKARPPGGPGEGPAARGRSQASAVQRAGYTDWRGGGSGVLPTPERLLGRGGPQGFGSSGELRACGFSLSERCLSELSGIRRALGKLQAPHALLPKTFGWKSSC